MKRLSAAIVASAGVVLMGACTDASRVVNPSSTVDLAPSYTQTDVTPDDAKEKHIAFMPTMGQAKAQRDGRSKGGGGSGTGINYHGGSVLQRLSRSTGTRRPFTITDLPPVPPATERVIFRL